MRIPSAPVFGDRLSMIFYVQGSTDADVIEVWQFIPYTQSYEFIAETSAEQIEDLHFLMGYGKLVIFPSFLDAATEAIRYWN